jgi:Flp pilus assembly pilin Flp
MRREGGVGMEPPAAKRGELKGVYQAAIRWIMRARDDDGQAIVEYSLILLLVALVTFATFGALGDAVEAMLGPVLAGL